MLASLLLSQGVPMLLVRRRMPPHPAGQQQRLLPGQFHLVVRLAAGAEARALLRFYRALVEFRKAEPTVRRTDFLTGLPVRPGGLPDVSWFSPAGGPVNWTRRLQQPGVPVRGRPRRDVTELPNHHVLIMLHAGSEPYKFTIPKIARGYAWWLFIDTAAHSPRDIYPDLKGPSPPASGVVELEGRSLMCFVARDEA